MPETPTKSGVAPRVVDAPAQQQRVAGLERVDRGLQIVRRRDLVVRRPDRATRQRERGEDERERSGASAHGDLPGARSYRLACAPGTPSAVESRATEASLEPRAVLVVALLLAAPLAGCERPFVLLPGGALEGATAPAPASWSFTDEVKTIQLETRPADPYSVNIWVIALDEHLYVHAGASRSAWVEHMEADPAVRVRVGESIYELAAARVEEQAEFDRFSDAYEKKYGRRPRNENVAEAYLFRLGAR